MKTIYKQLIIWGGSLVVATSGSIAIFYDYSSHDYNDQSSIDTEKPDVEVTPQQALLNSIISLQNANIVGDINVSHDTTSINLNLNGDITLEDYSDIKFKGDLLLTNNGLNLEGAVQYFNNKIYLDFDNSHFYLETNDLMDFVDMIPNYGIGIALPDELTNMDFNSIMNQVNSMEAEKINNGYLFRLNLTEDIVLYLVSDESYNFTGVKTNKFYYQDTYIYLDFDVVEKSETLLTDDMEPNILQYQDFSPTFDLINVLMNTFKSETNTLNLKVDVNHLDNPYLILDGDISYDRVNSNGSFKGSVLEKAYDRSHEFLLGFSNENLYVNYNNLKLKMMNESINGLLNYILIKVEDTYLSQGLADMSSVLENVNVGDIIDNLSTVNNIISKVSVEQENVVITLDLTILGIDAKDINLVFNFNSEEFKELNINGLNVEGYNIDISLSSKTYSPITFTDSEYVAVDPVLSLIDSFEALSKENRFRLTFDALIDNLDPEASDITTSGGLQFDLLNKYGYGDLSLLDASNYQHNFAIDFRSFDEILFNYNNGILGKFSSDFFTDMFDMVQEILNNKDDHFYELFGSLIEQIMSLPIMQAINEGDYGRLFEIGLIESLDISTDKISLVLSGGLLGIDSTINLDLIIDAYAEDKTTVIKSLEISNFIYDNNSYNFSVNFEKFDDSLENSRLNPADNYIDFDSLALIFRLGINTAIYNHYEFDGGINLQTEVLGIPIDLTNIPINVKILNEQGNVSLAIDFPEVPLIWGVNYNGFNTENRKVSIYFKDNYIYIHRTERYKPNLFSSWKDYELTVKTTLDDFFGNMMNYICDTVFGLNDLVMSAIGNSTGSGPTDDNPIHYENLLNDFSYNSNSDRPFFNFKINLEEITKNSDISEVSLNVYEDRENKTFSGLDLTLSIQVLVQINIGVNFDLVDLGQTFTLDTMNQFIEAHQNDPVGEIIEN